MVLDLLEIINFEFDNLILLDLDKVEQVFLIIVRLKFYLDLIKQFLVDMDISFIEFIMFLVGLELVVFLINEFKLVKFILNLLFLFNDSDIELRQGFN